MLPNSNIKQADPNKNTQSNDRDFGLNHHQEFVFPLHESGHNLYK